MISKNKKREFDKFAVEIRIEVIKAFKDFGSGHIGGAMSIVDLLAVLYGEVMKYDSQNPKWDGRDWLVVSKGHSGPAVYAALAIKGFFERDLMKTLNQLGTLLPSHCDSLRTPGVDVTTGSLGQGISVAIGVAKSFKLDRMDNNVFLVLGDGECDEGQVWEGALAAAHFKLDNLITFIDNNKKQLDGYTDNIMYLGDLAAKFDEFGWSTQKVDGHDTGAIHGAVQKARKSCGRPSLIVLDTEKGKGCNYAEGVFCNHHMKVSPEMADMAIAELYKILQSIG